MLKHRFLKPIFNNRGVSIIEVMVAAGLASIVALGVATMLQNMFIEQKRVTLLATLRELKLKMETNIRDQTSWAKTMTANSGLTCLQNNTSCNATYTDPPNSRNDTPAKIILKDGANTTVFDLLSWGNVGTNGFTEAGAPCTTFSATAGAGNDTCPISYRLVYNIWCPGFAASCTNAQLKITGRLIFNPATGGLMDRFRSLINTGSLTITADGVNTDGKYDVSVKRNAVDTNITFRLRTFLPSSGAPNTITNCNTQGAGTCQTSLTRHPMNWVVVNDPQNIVSISAASASGNNFSFNANQAGPVHCNITVPAFATQGFTAELYDSTTPNSIASASTVAGLWSQSAAIINTRFVAQTGIAYQVRVKCQSPAPVGASGYDPAQCSLGFHMDPYNSGEQDIMTLSCVRLDKSL